MAEVKEIIPKFIVEATHERMGDLLIQSLQGVCNNRLRSRLGPMKKTINGEISTARTSNIPEVPGMMLAVNPAKCAIRITDPLRESDKADEYCAKVESYLKRVQMISTRIKGDEPREGVMDKDRMKTLCREIYNFMKKGAFTLHEGVSFTLEDCDKLPGNYLLNPGSMIRNSQPKYEKDLEAYAAKLDSMGV